MFYAGHDAFAKYAIAIISVIKVGELRNGKELYCKRQLKLYIDEVQMLIVELNFMSRNLLVID